MTLYKHSSGKFLKTLRTQKSNVNTYVIVDELGIPILKKSLYSAKLMEQHRIVTGFKNLTEIL